MKKNLSTVVTALALALLLVVCWVASANAEMPINGVDTMLLTRGHCAELLCKFVGTEASSEDDAVIAIQAKGIMLGYPDGSFGPELFVTRVEFLNYLSKIFDVAGTYNFRVDTRFEDVPEMHWSAGVVNFFDSIGLFDDIEKAEFFPDNSIDQATAEAWLSKLAEFN